MTILSRALSGEPLPDVCIVGSGPVGIALALECESLGLSVVMLESGKARVDPKLSDASRATIVDSRRHAIMEVAVCRAFGGTSWTWGGRCVPFDALDFGRREYVPESGWPINDSDVASWYAGALKYFSAGENRFVSPSPDWCHLSGDLTADQLERWSSEPRIAPLHEQRIRRSKKIALCLDSTVVDLELGFDGDRISGVVVLGAAGRSIVRARHYVLAAGGLETTRLLLVVQRHWPLCFGGSGGALGRYYMGHLSGKIADIALEKPADVTNLDFHLDSAGGYVRRRFTIKPEAQRSSGLLNIAFWLDNPRFHDARHQSGILSLVFLGLACPPIGRRLVAEAIRLAHIGPPPRRYGVHVLNVLSDFPRTVSGAVTILRERILARPRKPGFLVYNRAGKYALHYHAEPTPDPASRVKLTNRVDAFGMPRLAVDLRFSEADARSVVHAHDIIDMGLRASYKGRLEYLYPKSERGIRVIDQATDGLHQIGTTRMGTDAKKSIVDRDCRVHGISNLYVASSSVFPTASQASPTLLAAALALRLAHHLGSNPP